MFTLLHDNTADPVAWYRAIFVESVHVLVRVDVYALRMVVHATEDVHLGQYSLNFATVVMVLVAHPRLCALHAPTRYVINSMNVSRKYTNAR
jgi:hypothetical protein